jgi:hypothetical protein
MIKRDDPKPDPNGLGSSMTEDGYFFFWLRVTN